MILAWPADVKTYYFEVLAHLEDINPIGVDTSVLDSHPAMMQGVFSQADDCPAVPTMRLNALNIVATTADPPPCRTMSDQRRLDPTRDAPI